MAMIEALLNDKTSETFKNPDQENYKSLKYGFWFGVNRAYFRYNTKGGLNLKRGSEGLSKFLHFKFLF